jgi:acyl-CoA dehydrogenase
MRLADAIDSLERATAWLLKDPQSEAALAGATPYLRLFANAAGGALLAEQALAAARMAADGSAPARIALARFFAENIAVTAAGLETAVTEGATSVNASEAALAAS